MEHVKAFLREFIALTAATAKASIKDYFYPLIVAWRWLRRVGK